MQGGVPGLSDPYARPQGPWALGHGLVAPVDSAVISDGTVVAVRGHGHVPLHAPKSGQSLSREVGKAPSELRGCRASEREAHREKETRKVEGGRTGEREEDRLPFWTARARRLSRNPAPNQCTSTQQMPILYRPP